MKAIFGVILMSVMFLASVGGASATSYLQASSTDEQLAVDAKPKVVTMNSTDASKNIKQDKGVVTVNESGAFFLIALTRPATAGSGVQLTSIASIASRA